MTEERKERLELVSLRLEEILQTCREDFWVSCCELALGKDSLKPDYLDYSRCREYLGHREGVYLCLLYAQLFSVSMLLAEKTEKSLSLTENREELCCISRELLCQIFLMVQQKDRPEEIRDTLYWFYSDYCDLFVQTQVELLEAGKCLVFGGPMLLSDQACLQAAPYSQHVWDCGLYLGKRFEERFFQAVKKSFAKGRKETCRSYVGKFVQEVRSQEGFLLTAPQKEQWKHMAAQLRRMAE